MPHNSMHPLHNLLRKQTVRAFLSDNATEACPLTLVTGELVVYRTSSRDITKHSMHSFYTFLERQGLRTFLLDNRYNMSFPADIRNRTINTLPRLSQPLPTDAKEPYAHPSYLFEKAGHPHLIVR